MCIGKRVGGDCETDLTLLPYLNRRTAASGESDQRGADAVLAQHPSAGPRGGHEHHRPRLQEARQGTYWLFLHYFADLWLRRVGLCQIQVRYRSQVSLVRWRWRGCAGQGAIFGSRRCHDTTVSRCEVTVAQTGVGVGVPVKFLWRFLL